MNDYWFVIAVQKSLLLNRAEPMLITTRALELYAASNEAADGTWYFNLEKQLLRSIERLALSFENGAIMTLFTYLDASIPSRKPPSRSMRSVHQIWNRLGISDTELLVALSMKLRQSMRTSIPIPDAPIAWSVTELITDLSALAAKSKPDGLRQPLIAILLGHHLPTKTEIHGTFWYGLGILFWP
jgi:hypothetical protein